MFSIKFVIVLCVVGIVKGNDEFRVLDSIKQEYPCSSRGGMCTLAEDCPKDHLAKEGGLCPQQRSIGVECCHGVSVKETRCQKRGGSCFPGEKPCNQVYQFKEATDCPSDTTCCILVQ